MDMYLKLFAIITNSEKNLLEICICLQKSPVFLGREEIEREEKKNCEYLFCGLCMVLTIKTEKSLSFILKKKT